GGAGGGEERDADVARGGVALLDGEIAPELALRGTFGGVLRRPVAGEEEQVAGAHRGDVVRERRVRRRQRDVLGLQIRFGSHRSRGLLQISRRSCHSTRVSVKPVTTLPADSVVLLSYTNTGVEVLQLQSHHARQ